ncbi:hypothetical protein CQ018_08940 [Arthrobacter sp. MYb227]|uniref:hypothetical protein n=1 Tax=Arthrobacter sp. MYb227 TaxID=1848601 RepID=UPI000CFB7C16|nr:hypothetical protein [Arthrobacter sp. MYb227]PQZ93769.1 hypothetical protein CQ018_08940 [Arthrobacter sp. MYb227]
MTRMNDVRSETPPLVAGRDMRTFWRVTAAAVITLGPFGILMIRAIMPYWTTDSPDAIVSQSLANQGTLDLMVWSGIVFAPMLLLSVLAISYVARRGSPLLAMLGGGLGFVGWSMGATTVNMDYLVSQLGASGFDHQSITDIGDALQNSTFAAVGGIIWLIGHIVGMILTGIALGRAKILNWWVAGALMVSQPFHFIAAVVVPSRLLDVTMGWGLTTVASVFVSIALLKMSNDEWDLGPFHHQKALHQ